MITDISKFDVKRMTASRAGVNNKEQEPTIKRTPFRELSANIQMMDTYRRDWDSLHDFRQRYRRTCKFHRGKQWDDQVLVDGEWMTEDAYIREQGKLPLKQNIVRPLAKSLEGLFRSETGKAVVVSRKPKDSKTEKMLSNAVQYVLDVNKTREIDPRTFDFFILSGLPIQRIGYDKVDDYGRYDVVIDYIDPQYIFFNTDIKDVRLKDLRRIGQIHDVTFDELFVHFAKNDADKAMLRELYSGITQEEMITQYGLSSKRGENLNFYTADEPHKCRVIEVWEKRAVNIIDCWDKADGSEFEFDGKVEVLNAINEERIAEYEKYGIPEKEWLLIEYNETVGSRWFYKYLTPMGHVLREEESPYDHKSHPFVMYPYPLINGEVWGPIEDIIDQQKYINRLITLWDFIMGTSAKNTLVLDKRSLDGQSPEDIGYDYRQVGSTIVLDLANGAKMPVELGGKMANLGITELIGMQLKWMQDISGVQPAMQGQTGSANTPASKYAMEIQQTTLNNRDLMESFASFRKDRDMKVLHTIIQYYKGKRYMAISGKDGDQIYDPELIQDEATDFNLVISQSMDSPTYKSWVDEMLKEFVMGGLIDVEMFLTHSNLPFADALLEDLRNKQEQVQNGQMQPGQAVSQFAQNFNQQANVNPSDIDKASEIIKGQAA